MGNISDKLQYLAETKKAIKEAIEGKEVPVADADSFRSYAEKIMSIPQERRTPDKKSDVTFYDYDGTILHSYTKESFLALAEMPELPTRVGLICQGWNYEYEDARAYVGEYGKLDVGATYITDDGKTRLYITIAAEGRMDVPIYFQQTEANGVVVDWGDGSPPETFNSTSALGRHHYETIGDYVITLKVANGQMRFGRTTGYDTSVMGVAGDSLSTAYHSMLKKVEIGNGVTRIDYYDFYYCKNLSSVVIPNGVTSIGSHAFEYCYSLTSLVIPKSVTSFSAPARNSNLMLAVIPNSVTFLSFSMHKSLLSVVIPNSVTSITDNTFNDCESLLSVVIPKSVTSIGNYAFYKCYSLPSVVIPNSVTSIGSYAFEYCYSLTSLVIPKSVTSIEDSAFYRCYSLPSVVIPKSVTSIGSYAFADCKGVAFFDFNTHKSVPTLGYKAFNGIATDCKIIVPDSLYDEWIAAENWSTYASQIVKASEYNG